MAGDRPVAVVAVHDVVAGAGNAREELLRFAGAAEDGSEHPIARAIADSARDELGPLPAAERFQGLAGLGVEASIAGSEVLVGRPALLAARGLKLPAALESAREDAEIPGEPVVDLGAVLECHVQVLDLEQCQLCAVLLPEYSGKTGEFVTHGSGRLSGHDRTRAILDACPAGSDPGSF